MNNDENKPDVDNEKPKATVQDEQGPLLDGPASAATKPKAQKRKPPLGGWTFGDLHEWRRQRRKPRTRSKPLSPEESYKAAMEEQERATKRAGVRREEKERAIEKRGAEAFRKLMRIAPYHELLDALDAADRATAERAAKEIQATTGLEIIVPADWPPQHSDKP